jgi:hypothetical protein
MRDDAWAPYGAAAGAVAIGLFLAAAVVIGDQPSFDASGAEIAAHVEENRTRIQLGCALNALSMPFMVWFLATVASLARAGGPGTRRAGAVAFGCGLVFVALYLVDVTALAVSALRPENLAASPQLATVLRDLEWLPQGIAAFTGAGILASVAVLSLRDGALWPRWIGWLALGAAFAYALRVSILFTTEEPFSASGVLGLWLPVAALTATIAIASIALATRVRSVSEPSELFG